MGREDFDWASSMTLFKVPGNRRTYKEKCTTASRNNMEFIQWIYYIF
jgi:hypothetical protein